MGVNMTYAKAYVSGATAFLAILAAREVTLGWWAEALIAASVAAIAVYATPNR